MVHLPHELWRQIFIDATTIPGFLETEPRSQLGPLTQRETISFPFFDFRMMDVFLANAARDSMKTKLVIIQVASKWKDIAEYLLYELVVMTSQSQFEGFTQAIRKSWREDKCFGWFVKQVVIDLLPSCRRSRNDYIADILKLCPRLEMFSNYKVPGSFSHSNSETPTSSLRLLEWFGPSVDISALRGKLEALRISFHTANATILSLPRLHTLILDNALCPAPCQGISSMQHWILPALRNISLCSSPIECLAFFATHGPNIRALRLYSQSHVPKIISLCPSVEDLIIPLYSPTTPPFPSIKNLTRLGITGTYFLEDCGIGEEDYEGDRPLIYLCDFFDEFLSTERFPLLKLVRPLDFGGVFDLRDWNIADVHKWEGYLTRWMDAGVRLESRAEKLAELPSNAELLVSY